jgi:hypothetical protein
MNEKEKYSNSKIGDYDETCEWLYALKRIHRLVAKGEVAALLYGRGIHAGIDVFHDVRYGKLKHLAMTDGIDAAYAAFLKEYPRDLDEKRTQSTAKIIFQEYFEMHWDYPIDEVLATEQEQIIDFGDFDFIVKLDRIIRGHQGVSAMDTKTTSSWIANFIPTIRRLPQFTGYIKKAMELYGPSANTLIADIIHIPKPNKSGNIKRRDGSYMTDFARKQTTRTPMDFNEWERWVRKVVRRIRESTENNDWVQRCVSCHKWNHECAYLKACSTGLPMEKVVEWMKDRPLEYEITEPHEK